MTELFGDARAALDDRVADLLGRLTLDEKLAQLGTYFMGATPAENHHTRLSAGIGHISLVVSGATLEDNLAMVELAQQEVMAATEFGIPALVHAEALSGPMLAGGANFPGAIALAATWDPDGVEAMAAVTSRQLAAMGVHQAFSPVLDVARDPRWGRIGETYGEDPTLAAALGVAFVRGIQGDDLSTGVAATAKHFLGYAMGQGGLNMAATQLGWRELREVYAKPFAAAITEAGLASVMNSYSAIDGVPVAASTEILTDLLRGELGFTGLTVSDYGSVTQLQRPYGLADSLTDAAVSALSAGLDVEAPDFVAYASLAPAVGDGRLDESVIDVAVARVLRLKFRLGLFENPGPDRPALPSILGQSRDVDLAVHLARESMVLLQNHDALLPLAPQGRIAVIGPLANLVRPLFGAYSLPAAIELRTGAGTGQQGVEITQPTDGTQPPTIERLEEEFHTFFPAARTIVEAIREAAPDAIVTHAVGCELRETDQSGFAEAVELARSADVAILVVGGKDGWGFESCTTGEGLDSMRVGLTGSQEELVKQVHAAGTPVVVVHVSARPLSSPWIAEHVPAVLQAWHPGQGGARAISETLFGLNNPGGKLPMTAVRHEGQIPNHYAHPRGSGYAGRGISIWSPTEYVDGPGTPLYPFGHGLSYTTFAYGTPLVKVTADTIHVSCDVINTGDRDGSEVVQLYVSDRVATVARPVKELVGFRRIRLAPDSAARVTFSLRIDQLAFLDAHRRWVVEPGWFDVEVGSSSADIRGRTEFHLATGVAEIGVERGYVATSVVESAEPFVEASVEAQGAETAPGIDIPLGVLSADPEANAILAAFVPPNTPQSSAFDALTLRQVASYAPAIFTDDVLDRIATQLAQLHHRRTNRPDHPDA